MGSAGAHLALPSADRAPRWVRGGRGSIRHCGGFPLDLGLDHPTTIRPKRQGYSQDLHISARGGAPMSLVKLVGCGFGVFGTMCPCMLMIRLARVSPRSSRCSCGRRSMAAR